MAESADNLIHLDEDHENIIDKFLRLPDKTIEFLLQTNCETARVQACVMDVRHTTFDPVFYATKELVATESVEELFSVSAKRNFISFIDSEIIGRIIQTLCLECEDLVKMMKSYEIKLNEYMKLSISNTSFCYLENQKNVISKAEPEDLIELSIVTSNTWNQATPLDTMLIYGKAIVNAFKCQKFVIRLKKIDPERLAVYYGISCYHAYAIFPLTKEEWNYLEEQGIVEMHCTEFHYIKHLAGTCMLLNLFVIKIYVLLLSR